MSGKKRFGEGHLMVTSFLGPLIVKDETGEKGSTKNRERERESTLLGGDAPHFTFLLVSARSA